MILPYEDQKERLTSSPFRSRFHLTQQEKRYIAFKGWAVLEGQARKILTERLAPARPKNDGKQTPMRGHVIFKAQHATATCCRGCLEKWHGIRQGRTLTAEEISAAVGLLLGWLKAQVPDLSALPVQQELF